MKRFVTYLYQYENGVRGKNVGFARIEVRDGRCRMEVAVKGIGGMERNICMYVFLQNEKCILLERMAVAGGNASFVTDFEEQNIKGSGYDFSDIRGLILKNEKQHIASSWVDDASERLTRGEIQLVEEKKETEPVGMLQEEEERLEEKPVPVSEGSVSYRRIDITDIRQMPKKNWFLCNNNFLIHGFFNYHYLLEKHVKEENGEKWYLGVPGVYEKPERMVASLFGFMEFEPAEQETHIQAVEKTQAGEDCAFGYYLCPLSINE